MKLLTIMTIITTLATLFIKTEGGKPDVLLLGNSLSRGLKMKGFKLKDLTKNSVPLSYFANDEKTMKEIGNKNWDVIILQEQSSFLFNSLNVVMVQSVQFIKKIKEAKNSSTRLMLIETWPQRSIGFLEEQNERRIRSNVDYIKRYLNIEICYVGKAIIESKDYQKLYKDRIHLNKKGIKFYAKVLKACINEK